MPAAKPASSAGRPPADVFLPASGAGGGGPRVMGINRNLFIALAVGTAVVAYLVWRHYRNNQSLSSSAASSTGIDPQTGFPYGSPEDLAALGGGGGGGTPDSGAPQSSTPSEAVGSGTQTADALNSLAEAVNNLALAGVSTSGSTAPTNTTSGATGGNVSPQILPGSVINAPNRPSLAASPTTAPSVSPAAGPRTPAPIQQVEQTAPQVVQATAAAANALLAHPTPAPAPGPSAASGRVLSAQVAAARPGGTSSRPHGGVYAIH